MGNVREGQLKLLLDVIESKKEELRLKEQELASMNLSIQQRLKKMSLLEEEFRDKQTSVEENKKRADNVLSELTSLKNNQKKIQDSFQKIIDQMMLLTISVQDKVRQNELPQKHLASMLAKELENRMEKISLQYQERSEEQLARAMEKISRMVDQKMEQRFHKFENAITAQLAQREARFENLLRDIIKKEKMLYDYEMSLSHLMKKIESKTEALDKNKKPQASSTNSFVEILPRKQSQLDN